MLPRTGPTKALLPSLILALTGLAIVLATGGWLLVRSGERDQLLRDHVESERVVAETAAPGIVAILEGLASDLDRLSRVASVRYLQDPARLRRTLGSFLERTAVPVVAVMRVDTTGRVFVYPEQALAEPAIAALHTSGYLPRAGSSRTRLLSPPVHVSGDRTLVAFSDLIQPDDSGPLGAIIALFPAAFLAGPIEQSARSRGHRAVLRYADGTVLHATSAGGPLRADRMTSAGSWSVYWYNGVIVSSEIARGLDILELTPSGFLTQNEIDAANTVELDYLNVQSQPKFTWPASFALARAYLDQLERSDGLAADRIRDARRALAAAESRSGDARRQALTTLSDRLREQAAAATDAAKVRVLADAVRGLVGS